MLLAERTLGYLVEKRRTSLVRKAVVWASVGTVLSAATLIGEAMAKANDFDKRQMELSHYADGVHWHISLCLDPSQEATNYTQLDERAAWFYEATATSQGMVIKTPGVGSVHLGTYKDKDGDRLDGATI
jgi:hypothetical protein